MSNTDKINPNHYKQRPYECIHFTQHMSFCHGNAFKYVWRYMDKNGLEDLEKAKWYINQIIANNEFMPKCAVTGYDLEYLLDNLYDCGFTDTVFHILYDLLNSTVNPNTVLLLDSLIHDQQ